MLCIMITGWLQLGNTWYYMDASGAMAAGKTVIIGGKHILLTQAAFGLLNTLSSKFAA